VEEEDNKVDLKEVDWVHKPQDRYQWLALVNTAMNLRFPKSTGTFS
jgi:hypothetical protein